MTNLPPPFISYMPCSRETKVCVADESLSFIASQGSIRLSNMIVLQSVLHIPKLTCNLLYVSPLCKDSNCCLVFDAYLCEFQGSTLHMMIGNARLIENFNYFDDIWFEDKQPQALLGVCVQSPCMIK